MANPGTGIHRALTALVGLCATVAGCSDDAPIAPTTAPATATTAAGVADEATLRAAWVTARQAEGLGDARYHAERPASGSQGFVAAQPALRQTASLDLGAVTVSQADDASITLRTTGVGCRDADERWESVEPGAAPRTDAAAPHRVEYTQRAGALAFGEWYVSGPLGLEQGWTLAESPCAGGPVAIEVAAEGLTPAVTAERVALLDEAGARRGRVDALWAVDAAGAPVPARFAAVADDAQRWRVELETGAHTRWPVTIDPLVALEEALLALDHPDPLHPNGAFGTDVAVSGETALVGAPTPDGGGAAWVFRRSGTVWSYQARLVGTGDTRGFGSAVALEGDRAVVGAQFESFGFQRNNSGAAYVFARTGTAWALEAKLSEATPMGGRRFGAALALEGDTLVTRTSTIVGTTTTLGNVHVLVRSGTTWSEQARMSTSDQAEGDALGEGVDGVVLSGATLAVGVPNAMDAAFDQKGAVYVFDRTGTTWAETQKLVASDGVEGDGFGTAIALQGDELLVGAPGRDAFALLRDEGAVYPFARTGTAWLEGAPLLGSTVSVANRAYGRSLALRGDRLVVGAIPEPTWPVNAHAYVRSGTAWSVVLEPLIPSVELGSAFSAGSVAALDGDVVLFGASQHDAAQDGLTEGRALAYDWVGTEWFRETDLLPSMLPERGLGESLAIDGDTAALGAPNDAWGGSAYLFGRSGTTWSLTQRLIGSSVGPGDLFGTSLALQGGVLLVGAPRDTVSVTRQGSAFVFARAGTAWTEQQRLTHTAPGTSDDFGSGVALSGDLAVVGAPNVDAGVGDGGAAFVFQRTGTVWAQAQRLLTSDRQSSHRVGEAIAVEGDRIVLGAYLAGGVYVFERSGSLWTERQKLTTTPGNGFGYTVALQGDTLLVGADGETVGGNLNQGAVFAYRRGPTAWAQEARLTVPTGVADQALGISLALDGNTAVAASGGPPAGGGVAPSYVFVRAGSSWSLEAALAPAAARVDDALGFPVALSGHTVLLGARNREVGAGLNVGAAWVMRLAGLSGDPCTGASECAGAYACIDGVCCDAACTGSCQVCSVAAGAPADGACTAVAAGTPGSPTCAGGVLCDGAAGVCPSGCDDDAHCPAGSFCTAARTCAPTRATGSACDPATDCRVPGDCALCLTGSCVDGFCCNEACGGACEACSATLSQGANGTCAAVDAGVTGAPPCSGGVLCDGVARSCPGGCTADGQCPGGEYCVLSTGACAPRQANGAACVGGNQCASAQCVDGVCCDTACTGLCQACSAVLKVTGADGTCGDARAGTDPRAQCSQDSPTSCGQTGACDGAGACARYDAATVCGIPSCSGGSSVARVCSAPYTCTATGVSTPCGAYRCQLATGECFAGCNGDAECAAGHYCDTAQGACVVKQQPGASCTAGTQCASTFCVEGVCCDSACAGLCQSCTAAGKQSGADDGQCGNARTGADPGDRCLGSTPSSCGLSGACAGDGTCAFHASGTACGTAVCNGNSASGRICDGSGACVTDAAGVDCAPYRCVGSGCASPCTADGDCLSGNRCSGGACVPLRLAGEGCVAAAECASGFCADGVCCDTACTGQCEACAEAASPGSCVPVAGAPRRGRLSCSGAGTCQGACNGADTTTCAYPAAGTPCAGAVCAGDSAQPAGACDGAGVCATPALVACAPYACSAGACRTACASSGDCAAGAACDVNGACTTAGATCRDAFTVLAPDGTESSCAPYRCLSGACQQQCVIAADCAPGFTCEAARCAVVEGGAGGVGGSAGTAGGAGSGGAAGAGGVAGAAGSAATAGSGGSAGSGGAVATGGSAGDAGGVAGSAGTSASGGSAGTSAPDGGATGGAASGGGAAADDGGCGCRAARSTGSNAWSGVALIALATLRRRRVR